MMKTRFILTTAVMVLVVMMFAVNGCGGGGSSSGGEDEPDTIVETPALYNEKEITAEGGSISITDEYNNTIEVIFPKYALSKTTQISVGVLSEQPDLPIETRHVSTFEIKPYNTELYKPVSVKVTYENAIQDINRTALFRKETDSLLVPLAYHEYGADNKTVEAEAYLLGLFAEGKMALDQIINQIDLLLASQGVDRSQKNALILDSSRSTANHKAIWDKLKAATRGWLTFMALLESGDPNYEEEAQEWEDLGHDMVWLCENLLSLGVERILNESIPEDLCDKDYMHAIVYAMESMSMMCDPDAPSAVYIQLLDRLKNIDTKCKVEFVTDTDNVIVPEGDEASFQVKLNREPSSSVRATVFRIEGDKDIFIKSGSTLIFNELNWDDYRMVTLSALKDKDSVNGRALFNIEGDKLFVQNKRIAAIEIDEENKDISLVIQGSIDNKDPSYHEEWIGVVSVTMRPHPLSDCTLVGSGIGAMKYVGRDYWYSGCHIHRLGSVDANVSVTQTNCSGVPSYLINIRYKANVIEFRRCPTTGDSGSRPLGNYMFPPGADLNSENGYIETRDRGVGSNHVESSRVELLSKPELP